MPGTITSDAAARLGRTLTAFGTKPLKKPRSADQRRPAPHWIDPTSRELLDLTVDRVRRLPVLLAVTFRPEFQPPWGGRSHVTSLALNRLGERAGEALVHKLAGNAALTPEIVAEIAATAPLAANRQSPQCQLQLDFASVPNLALR
jgi:hypothetical protein